MLYHGLPSDSFRRCSRYLCYSQLFSTHGRTMAPSTIPVMVAMGCDLVSAVLGGQNVLTLTDTCIQHTLFLLCSDGRSCTVTEPHQPPPPRSDSHHQSPSTCKDLEGTRNDFGYVEVLSLGAACYSSVSSSFLADTGGWKKKSRKAERRKYVYWMIISFPSKKS